MTKSKKILIGAIAAVCVVIIAVTVVLVCLNSGLKEVKQAKRFMLQTETESTLDEVYAALPWLEGGYSLPEDISLSVKESYREENEVIKYSFNVEIKGNIKNGGLGDYKLQTEIKSEGESPYTLKENSVRAEVDGYPGSYSDVKYTNAEGKTYRGKVRMQESPSSVLSVFFNIRTMMMWKFPGYEWFYASIETAEEYNEYYKNLTQQYFIDGDDLTCINKTSWNGNVAEEKIVALFDNEELVAVYYEKEQSDERGYVKDVWEVSVCDYVKVSAPRNKDKYEGTLMDIILREQEGK